MSDEGVTRRGLLKTVGIGAVAGVAGCNQPQTDAVTPVTARPPVVPDYPCPSVEYVLNTGYDQDAGTVLSNGDDDDDWEITADDKYGSGSVPREATVVEQQAWPSPFSDSQWISIDQAAGLPLPSAPSQYEYTYCFCLNEGFLNPELQFAVQADDAIVDIELNGTSLPYSGTGSFQDDPIEVRYTEYEHFTCGENCLTITVEDQHRVISGMILTGTMTADNADCACSCGGGKTCQLSIRKGVKEPFSFSGTGTYAILVCNHGEEPCEEPVEVTDDLPAGIDPGDVYGTGWTATTSGGTVVAEHANAGGLAPGDCLPTLYIEGAVVAHDDWPHDVPVAENCAELAWDGSSQTAISCVEHEIERPHGKCHLSVEKSTRGEFEYGEHGYYVIQVCNDGEEPCEGVVEVHDDLPDGMTFVGVSGSGWTGTASGGMVVAEHGNAGGLAPGDCLPTLVIEVEVADIDDWPGGSDGVRNCVRVFVEGEFGGEDCVTHVVTPGDDSGSDECDLSLSKEAASEFHYGENGTYVFEICNEGDEECTGELEIIDDLPDGISFVDVGGNWSASTSGGVVELTNDSYGGLAPGECIEVELVVEVGNPDEFTSDAVVNCAELFHDGAFVAEDCVRHVIQ